MKKTGYIVDVYHTNKRLLTVYWSIRELRSRCGELTKKEIKKVEVEFNPGA